MTEYRLNVLQENNKQRLFVIECGADIKEELLQVAGMLLDGGFGRDDWERLLPCAQSYVYVEPVTETAIELHADPLRHYVERLRALGVTGRLAVSLSNGQIDDRRYLSWYVHFEGDCQTFDSWQRVEEYARKFVTAREAAKESMLAALS